jgi:hypothetical protein
VKIVPNQLFLDGYDRYEKDQEYEVDDRDGARFVGNGWASSPDYELPGRSQVMNEEGEVVTIQPDSIVHETRVEGA